jgi:hypothetical protein
VSKVYFDFGTSEPLLCVKASRVVEMGCRDGSRRIDRPCLFLDLLLGYSVFGLPDSASFE